MDINDILAAAPTDGGYVSPPELRWFVSPTVKGELPQLKADPILAQRVVSMIHGMPDVWVAVPEEELELPRKYKSHSPALALTPSQEQRDEDLEAIAACLVASAGQQEGNKVDAYRAAASCVHIRVVCAQFCGRSADAREAMVFSWLQSLQDAVYGQVTVVLCLTPYEMGLSRQDAIFEAGRPR